MRTTKAESELNRLRAAARAQESPDFKLLKGYIREKLISGRAYYYVVVSERVNGRVRQKVLAYLGSESNPKTALTRLSNRLDSVRRDATTHQQAAENITQRLAAFSRVERLCADLPALERSRQRHVEQSAKAESEARVYEFRIKKIQGVCSA